MQQTALFKDLGISPLQIESVMEAFLAERRRARAAFAKILSAAGTEGQRETILSVLHSIAAGLSPGKDAGAHCLLAAFGRRCPDPEGRGCLACGYRIETRATLYLAAAELGRLQRLKKESRTEGSRRKYALIAEHFLLPSMARTIAAAREVYGEEAGGKVRSIVLKAMGRSIDP